MKTYPNQKPTGPPVASAEPDPTKRPVPIAPLEMSGPFFNNSNRGKDLPPRAIIDMCRCLSDRWTVPSPGLPPAANHCLADQSIMASFLSLNLHPSNPPFSPKAGVTSTSLPLFPLIGVIAPCDPPLIDLSFSVSYGIDIFAVMRAYT